MKKPVLSDYCKFLNGGAWNESEYTKSGVPVLKVSNMKKDGFIYDSIDYLSIKNAKNYSKNLLQKFDVVIATVGSHPNLVDSAAGRATVIPKSISNYLLNQNAVCLRTKNKEELNQRYLGYLAKSEHFQNYIQNRGKGAANQMRIPIGDIKSYPSNLPPLPTQRKIAKILSAYDDLIENNLKRIKLLEEMAQKTYEDWFVRFKFPGHETAVFDEESGLPEGWKKKSITNFSSFKQDKSKLKPFINTKTYFATADVDETKITSKGEIITWKNKPSRAQIKPNKNTVWFARMSNTYKVLCFNNKNIELQNNSVLSSGFAGFKATNNLCLPFLYFTINSSFFHEMKNIYATGATQVSLNNESMRFMIIPEPTIEMIEKYGIKTLPLIEEVSVLVNQNQYLKEARDILLPRLMTGTIDVEKIETEL